MFASQFRSRPLTFQSQMDPFMLQQQPPTRRAAYLPLIALAGTVMLAAAMPLVATAGTAGSSPPGGTGPRQDGADNANVPGTHGDRSGARAEAGAAGGHSAQQLTGGPAASCGPQVASAEGMQAQTCVLREEHESWARTYYRNRTNSPMRAVLTLMRPDGSSVRAHCTMPAGGAPGVCETPREPTGSQAAAYGQSGAHEADGRSGRESAMAEIGTAGGDRPALRSGSNSPML